MTGSSSGIGAAIARALAAAGATVVVNSASSVADGERLAAELPDASYIQADIGHPQQVDRLVAGAIERHERLDILVNNAGVTEVIAHHDLEAVTDEVWNRILKVNVVGTWNVTRAAVPHLRAGGDGIVVNVTSLAGVRPVGSSIPYAVSKAALNHLALLLANTLGPEIRVNAVAPGLIDTPWTGTSSVRSCGILRHCAGQVVRRTWRMPAWDSSAPGTPPARFCWSTGAWHCGDLRLATGSSTKAQIRDATAR